MINLIKGQKEEKTDEELLRCIIKMPWAEQVFINDKDRMGPILSTWETHRGHVVYALNGRTF
jgi:hypothetical protein